MNKEAVLKVEVIKQHELEEDTSVVSVMSTNGMKLFGVSNDLIETADDLNDYLAINREFKELSNQLDELATFLYQEFDVEPRYSKEVTAVAIKLLMKIKSEKKEVNTDE